MAYYSESGYCAEEMNRPAAYYGGEGSERYAVRKEYELIDEVERARRGHHYGHHGHLGHGGGSYREHVHGHGHGHEHFGGGHREHGHGYGGRPYDGCESKYYG
ncbi:hypothetical protein PR202_ga08552 [Eleusine coracana subsp. coracana]|uniref:Uncharacterized protein n=1 Tax=Eleusine coracana subsp. coracana TaxID=191504 RepID=A0AAV5C0V5_ELECO|nr:hypothetical protein PR202_ga08552 [Eleusine coracana subsp. coracana]